MSEGKVDEKVNEATHSRLLEVVNLIASSESKRRAHLLNRLSKSRRSYRLNVRLAPEAKSVLAEAMREDPTVTTITELINKIIIEWHTMKSKLNVNLSGLEKEVADLEKKLEKINGWLDLLEKRLIKITARAGAVLIKGGK